MAILTPKTVINRHSTRALAILSAYNFSNGQKFRCCLRRLSPFFIWVWYCNNPRTTCSKISWGSISDIDPWKSLSSPEIGLNTRLLDRAGKSYNYILNGRTAPNRSWGCIRHGKWKGVAGEHVDSLNVYCIICTAYVSISTWKHHLYIHIGTLYTNIDGIMFRFISVAPSVDRNLQHWILTQPEVHHWVCHSVAFYTMTFSVPRSLT